MRSLHKRCKRPFGAASLVSVLAASRQLQCAGFVQHASIRQLELPNDRGGYVESLDVERFGRTSIMQHSASFTRSSCAGIRPPYKSILADAVTHSRRDVAAPILSDQQALGAQSVLVIGSGAVGCLYGGRLLEAGHNVTFLMRRDLHAVRQKGLRISSPDGDMYFQEPSVVASAEEYAKLRHYESPQWIILALKSTSFAEIPKLLSHGVVGPETRVVLLMNGYGLEQDLTQYVPGHQVFGGMAFVCANRGPTGSGEVAHLKYGKVTFGHYADDPAELACVRRLWKDVKIDMETTDSLLRARHAKLCWNIPFNGLGVLLGGVTTDKIVQTPELREMASRIMLDVINAANAELGVRYPAKQAPLDTLPSRISRDFHDRMFALTDVMGPYLSSTVLDLQAGLPMETEYMFNRPLQRAKELGVNVPYMEMVCRCVEGIRKLKGL